MQDMRVNLNKSLLQSYLCLYEGLYLGHHLWLHMLYQSPP